MTATPFWRADALPIALGLADQCHGLVVLWIGRQVPEWLHVLCVVRRACLLAGRVTRSNWRPQPGAIFLCVYGREIAAHLAWVLNLDPRHPLPARSDGKLAGPNRRKREVWKDGEPGTCFSFEAAKQ